MDIHKIKKDVIGAFPLNAQSDIASALSSKEFQNGSRLLVYGGLEGMMKAQMERGMTQDAACARISGAIEQSYRTFRTKWHNLVR